MPSPTIIFEQKIVTYRQFRRIHGFSLFIKSLNQIFFSGTDQVMRSLTSWLDRTHHDENRNAQLQEEANCTSGPHQIVKNT